MVPVSSVIPVQDGDSSWIFTIGISHAALRKVMLSTQLSNRQLIQHLLPEQGVAERWRHDVHSIPAATRGLEWGLLQGRQVKGLKWYTYHCRPSVAMIVDLFVFPGLCFQSLSTFYCRFYCRPYKPLWFISVTSTRKMSPLCVEDKQTRMEDEMNCRTKV